MPVLKDLYAQHPRVISFELFPPKTDAGMDALFDNLRDLMQCNPHYVTCTYGAGGSTRSKTLEVLTRFRAAYPAVPCASHLTCVGATRDELEAYVREALALGIENIVALRGDPPAGETHFKAIEGGLSYANELVALLRERTPQVGIAVGGYPEMHQEAPSLDADIDNLKRKVDAGADVIITQLFYDNGDFLRWRDQCVAAGIHTPIVPGMLPVINLSQAQRITQLCGAKLPDTLVQRLQAHGEDAEGQLAAGAYYTARQVEDLLTEGVPGVHFYVLNKSNAATLICRALALHVGG
jgi:methylenetetrahydrofolate reductase (NADPH)